jgi:peptidoglycan-associated lipoprotein
MKISNLLACALGIMLTVISGCTKKEPRVTRFNDPSATTAPAGGRTGGPGSESNFNTSPIGGITSGSPAGSAVTGNPNDPSLPDDSKLLGRPQDRATFAKQIIYFEFDRASIQPKEAAKIDEVIAVFKTKGGEYDLLIEGHCDERGTEEYNRALGERRALAIRELLVKAGVNSGQVFTKSFGKDKPANPGHDEAAWSSNRRGEFILVLPGKTSTTQNAQ